jgi:hypothetical protein
LRGSMFSLIFSSAKYLKYCPGRPKLANRGG